MDKMNIGFETLNAYVDGELNAAETADVAMAIAQDASLAQQVSVLTRLRSSIIEGALSPEIELPKPPANANRPTRGLLVASIVFFAFITGSFVLSSIIDRPLSPHWYEVTLNALQNWPEDGPANAPFIEADVSSGPLSGAYVPDLSAAKLYINHVEDKMVPDVGDLRVIGYRGTRGCRVILAIFVEGGGFPSKRIFLNNRSTQTYAWKAGRLGYAMTADGMDAKRFRLVAKSVQETTMRRLPVDAKTRLALGESRQRSAPCQA